VAALWASTFALLTVLPDWSVTTPNRTAVSDCANINAAAQIPIAKRREKTRRTYVVLFILVI
jgi:hypothetical protein